MQDTVVATRQRKDVRRFLLDNIIFIAFAALCVALALFNPQFLDVNKILSANSNATLLRCLAHTRP